MWDVDYGDMLSDEELLAFPIDTVEVLVLCSDEEKSVLFSKGLR